MKSIMFGAQAILLGQADVIVAGGMESMSQTPYYNAKQRFGSRMGHFQVTDGVIKDGLWCSLDDHHMGDAAECNEPLKIHKCCIIA